MRRYDIARAWADDAAIYHALGRMRDAEKPIRTCLALCAMLNANDDFNEEMEVWGVSCVGCGVGCGL